MYKVDKNTNIEGSSLNYLDVGIHENVELIDVKYQKNPDSNSEFFAFTFEKDGKQLVHTEWKPNDADIDKLENKEINQIRRFKHIITKFIPEDQYEMNVTTFKEFAEQTIKLLGDNYKGKKVRIKVVYNWNNYTTLPRYIPFIESMEIPEDTSKLEVISIDKMKKEVADATPTNENPLGDYTTPQVNSSEDKKDSDNLPF